MGVYACRVLKFNKTNFPLLLLISKLMGSIERKTLNLHKGDMKMESVTISERLVGNLLHVLNVQRGYIYEDHIMFHVDKETQKAYYDGLLHMADQIISDSFTKDQHVFFNEKTGKHEIYTKQARDDG